MSTDKIASTGKVTIELNLSDFVDHVWDDEGDVVDTTASHSAKAQVVERVAQLISRGISKDVRDAIQPIIDAQVGQIIEETMNGSFHLVGEFGSSGPLTSVREQIAKAGKEYLNKRERYNSPTNIEKFIDKAVQQAIVNEFSKIIKDEKAKVAAKLQAAAATLLAKEMKS